MKKLFLLIILLTAISMTALGQGMRAYGYINAWDLQMGAGVWQSSNYENMLFSNLDRDACTDYVMFNTNFNTDGTMRMANDWYPTSAPTAWANAYFVVPKRRFFNNWIHAANKKIHLCFFVSGGGGDWTTQLNSATTRNAMIKTIVDSVIGSTNQYDGVNFDIEPLGTQDTANIRIFFSQLRDTLNKYHQWVDQTKKPEISICFFDSWNQCKYWATMAYLLDAIHHMSYNMTGNWEYVSWYNAPVYQTGYENSNVASIDTYVKEFLAAGIPKNKLVMGCPTNYNGFRGGTVTGSTEGCYAPLLTFTTANYPGWVLLNKSLTWVTGYSGIETYHYLWDAWLDTATTTLHYDAVRKASWLGINKSGNANDMIVGFQDTNNVRDIIQYVASQGLQGIMVWELTGSYVNSLPDKRHPTLAKDHLMQAIKNTRLAITPPPPVMYTLSTSAVGSGTISASPSGGSYVSGTTVTLTAMPSTGYSFSGWSGSVTGTTNPISLVISANASIVATFTLIPVIPPVVNIDSVFKAGVAAGKKSINIDSIATTNYNAGVGNFIPNPVPSFIHK